MIELVIMFLVYAVMSYFIIFCLFVLDSILTWAHQRKIKKSKRLNESLEVTYD